MGLAGVRWGLAAAAIVMLAAVHPAHADDVFTHDCLAGGWSFSCVDVWREGVGGAYVVQVPEPASAALADEAKERDRLWVARCNPTIKQDAYGVRRYHYAAPGCEFGKYE
jgi:hypothetical protein